MIALDIGGTKIACGIVEQDDVTHYASVPTPAQDGPTGLLDAAWGLASAVHDAHIAAGGQPQAMLACASAGVIDPKKGLVTSATDALRGWAGTELRGELAERSGLLVSVLNDVHAHALGEYVHGRGKEHSSMLLIAAGTGIGGGLIVHDQLVLGARNVAGHVGHVDVSAADRVPCSCGNTGHLEGIASGTGIEQCFERLTGQRLSGGRIATLAETAQPMSDAARQVIRTAGYSLGRVIGGFLNSFDPGLVVLAGSVTRAGQVWRTALDEGIAESAMPIVADTEVVLAQLDNAALVGAAVWAKREEIK